MTDLERLVLVILAAFVIAAAMAFAALPEPHKDDSPRIYRHESPYFGKVWRDPADGLCIVDNGIVVMVWKCDERNIAVWPGENK